jgi:Resolvase, N terminal domain
MRELQYRSVVKQYSDRLKPGMSRIEVETYLRSNDHAFRQMCRIGVERDAWADLVNYGVAFVSLRDNLDLSTPSGRLMFQIIGAMAEFERALIQERVKARC